MEVIVQRSPGTHPGPDIIEPLIATPAEGIERGRAAIDKAAATGRARQLIAYRDGEEPGRLIEVNDASQGATWRGLVVGISIRGAGADVTIEQDIRRA